MPPHVVRRGLSPNLCMMADTKIPVLLDRYIDTILRRRWLVIVSAGLIMLAMTGGVPFIGVTNDYRSLFDEGNPQLAAFDALEATYTDSNTALIAISPGRARCLTGRPWARWRN